MKRAIGAVLAAVILMVSCLSGCGGGGEIKISKDTFPDNGKLKLSASEEKIIQSQGLESRGELYEELSERFYFTKEGSPTEICGVPFNAGYRFDDQGSLISVSYTACDLSDMDSLEDTDANLKSFNQIKAQFDSVYGKTDAYNDEENPFKKADWKTSDDLGNSYHVCLWVAGINGPDGLLNLVVEKK